LLGYRLCSKHHSSLSFPASCHVLSPGSPALTALGRRAGACRRSRASTVRPQSGDRYGCGWRALCTNSICYHLRSAAIERAFVSETRAVREGSWTCAAIPADILDRRVEITGPVDRKMIINALNSGANVYMADFEDANTPSWDNNLQGHLNLRDAIRRRIDYVSPEGKAYKLNDTTATLFVRPRGWHLPEKHVKVDGESISGGIFDFALYCFHNAKELLARRTGPYFYLPKLESYLEARLWNDIFVAAQETLGLPRGTIKATVLIETVLASFEMDEILYELREHSAGLNCGRWDYIFSCIK